MVVEAAFAAVVLLYLGVLVIPGYLSMANWRKVAAAYPTEVQGSEAPPAARVVTSPGLYAKRWRRFIVRDDGVLFLPAAQFKLTQGAALLPWADLDVREGKTMFQPAAALTTKQVPGVTVRVPGAAGEAILARATAI